MSFPIQLRHLLSSLVVGGAVLGLNEKAYGEDTTVPAFIEGLDAALQGANDRLFSLPQHHVTHGVNLIFAHGAFINSIPEPDIMEAIDALAEAGINRIDINPSVMVWAGDGDAPVRKIYTDIAKHVHDKGMLLAVNPLNQGVSLSATSLSDYQDLCLDAFPKMVVDMRPDIFIVVHEPSTMERQLKISGSAAEWAKFASATARTIRQVDPHVYIGVGGLSLEKPILETLMKLPEMSLFTLDIYSLKTLKDDYALATEAKKLGLQVYIEETWRPSIDLKTGAQTPGATIGDNRFEGIDAEWIRAMDLVGRTGDFQSVTYFWSNCFFLYGNGDVSGTDVNYQKAAAHVAASKQVSKTYLVLQEVCAKK